MQFSQSAEDDPDPRELSSEKKNLMVFPQDLKKLNHNFDDDMGSDMTKKECRQLCKTAWGKQHWFVIIDLSSKKQRKI